MHQLMQNATGNPLDIHATLIMKFTPVEFSVDKSR